MHGFEDTFSYKLIYVFAINDDKVKTNSESLKQDVMSGISLGSSSLLDAIYDDKFVITGIKPKSS